MDCGPLAKGNLPNPLCAQGGWVDRYRFHSPYAGI